MVPHSANAVKVWASMTTIPSRVDFIAPAIKSILDEQTRPVDGLILNLPYEVGDRSASLRSQGLGKDMLRWYPSDASLPSFLKRERLIINRSCKDIGALTKLVPTLARAEVSTSDMIITIDDDVAYGNLTVERLVTAAMEKYPNAAVGLEGCNITSTKHPTPSPT